MPARSSTSLGLLAGELGVEGAQVDQHEVVVGAARHQAEALAGQRRRPAPRRCATIWRGVVRELGCGGLAERHRLGRDDVLERAALQAGEHRLVDGRRRARPRLRMQPPRGPRSVLWVVKVTMSA